MLTTTETKIYERGLKVSLIYHRAEVEAIEVLQRSDELKIFRKFDKSSLFQYAVEILGFSESVAYGLIAVARKSKQVPELHQAILDRTIAVGKATRIVSAVNSQNAAHLIKFAANHSARAIDMEVAKINPKAVKKSRVRFISEEFVEVTIAIPKSTYEKLKRCATLVQGDLEKTMDTVCDYYIKTKDPIKKAERAVERNPELCTYRVGDLNAQEKHQVYARDKGQCTHIDRNGKRCANTRWVQIHHLIPRSAGGTNHPSNLTTLCQFHHRQIHERLTSSVLDGSLQQYWSAKLPAQTRPQFPDP
jgi:hypothetical protein